ncbi:MAG TPA: hypothetical protein VJ302_08535, partial [Blastocatellia bacterium]|nr:hypothetical protein [Blastocatellia bacterium]
MVTTSAKSMSVFEKAMPLSIARGTRREKKKRLGFDLRWQLWTCHPKKLMLPRHEASHCGPESAERRLC